MSSTSFRKLMFLSVVFAFLSFCQENDSTFINKLEKGKQVTIVTLGTSLTGGKWRWVDVMQEWLDASYPNQVLIENLGVGASASMTVPAMEGNEYLWNKCGLDRIPETIAVNPDVVFIEFAVNDAYLPYDISIEQSRKNLESMIQSLKDANKDVEIILQTMNVVLDMPELNHKESSERPQLVEYIKMNKQVAKKYQLQLIDHYANWDKLLITKGRKEYLKYVTDGVHPNLEGYRLILLPKLKEVLK